MKFYIPIFFIFLFLSSSFTYAASEENECLKLLHEKIKTDNRFTNSYTSWVLPNWLKSVLYNENNNTKLDLDSYDNFSDYLVQNPIHKWAIKNDRESYGFNKYDFLSRRTNIATIITENNFNISNFVWFWRKSNFTFPLKTITEPQEWDKWSISQADPFSEFVLYTHHNFKWEFMSCWIFRVQPLWEWGSWENRKYSEISESWYFTNILNWKSNQDLLWWNKCNSWFEWEKLSSSDMDFYRMKTNVCVLGYDMQDFLSMHILAIAYDNDSDYLNEYIAFPLQVKAMKDLGTNPDWWLVAIRNKYLDFLDKNTCFSLIHNDDNPLPSFCWDNYSSDVNLSWLYSYKKSNLNLVFILNDVKDFLFPTSFAARELKNMDDLVEKSRWMTVFENFPYDQYKKILEIKDKDFRDYLLLSLNPKFEDYIEYKIGEWIILTPFEEVFKKCDINYSDRSDIVIDLLDKYKDINKIDFKNISYKNKKFWDCIIPYPDKENIWKEIDLSFHSNKILAKKINWTYEETPISPEMEQYAKELSEISNNYNKTLLDISNKLNAEEITVDEYNNLLEKTKIEYENNTNDFSKKYENIDFNNILKENLSENWLSIHNSNTDSSNNNKIIFYILLLLWIITLTFTVIKKNKNK